VIEFGYLTGWRIPSEVLTLEGRHVDFYGGEVKLGAANSKNKKPRTFPFTAALRTLLGRGSSARRRRTPAAQEAREQLSRPERSAIERQ
jgi:integrase